VHLVLHHLAATNFGSLPIIRSTRQTCVDVSTCRRVVPSCQPVRALTRTLRSGPVALTRPDQQNLFQQSLLYSCTSMHAASPRAATDLFARARALLMPSQPNADSQSSK
jgi:hypothetical protein